MVAEIERVTQRSCVPSSMQYNTIQKNGFSLVELSIVLVILGLLTGGILTGQALIRAAELRSVTTEFNQFQTAVMTFRDKYYALPGDMVDASDFWLYPGGSSANCPGTAGTGQQTCNGDGDGRIEAAAGNGEYGEMFTFWQHLANAGLINGSYTGIADTGTTQGHVISENAPSSKLSNAGWTITYNDASVGNSRFFALEYGNGLIFGSYGASSGIMSNDIMSPEEAWSIDTKLDDGKPAYGMVIGIEWNESCATALSGTAANNNFDADYFLSNNDNDCALYFRNLF